MKKTVLILYLIIIPIFNYGVTIYKIDDFDNYVEGYNLFSNDEYEYFVDKDGTLSATVTSDFYYSSPYSLKLDYTIPSGEWGLGLRKIFSTPIDFSLYKFIRLHIKKTNTNYTNYISLQLREADSSGNSDYENYYSPGQSLNFTNWKSLDYELTDFQLNSWSAAGGVFDLTKILHLEILISGDNSTGDIYLDDILLVPDIIKKSFPENNVIINSAFSSIKLYFNLTPNVETLNYIYVKNVTDNNFVAVAYNYNASYNILTLTPTASLEKFKTYEIIIPNTVNFRTSTATNFSYNDTIIKFKVDEYKLTNSTNKFQFTNGTILNIFNTNTVLSDTLFSADDLSVSEEINNLTRVGYGISLNPPTLKLNKSAYLILPYDNYTGDESTLSIYKKNNNKWYKMGGEINTQKKQIRINITEFGDYYIFSDSKTETPDTLIDVFLSSDIFTPNNDGVNDSLSIKVYILSDNSTITVRIYDFNENLIDEVAKAKICNAGETILNWDGKDIYNNTVKDGIYFLKVSINDSVRGEYSIIKLIGVKR